MLVNFVSPFCLFSDTAKGPVCVAGALPSACSFLPSDKLLVLGVVCPFRGIGNGPRAQAEEIIVKKRQKLEARSKQKNGRNSSKTTIVEPSKP